jgi:hypothetical protein
MNMEFFSDKVGKVEKDIEEKNKALKVSAQGLDKIKSNVNTVIVNYTNIKFKAAFDYVDSLFPASKVKELSVYFANAKYLDYLGYGGAGGFCDLASRAVVIAEGVFSTDGTKRIVGKASKDEVLVHELLHYCNLTERNTLGSTDLTTGDVNMHEEWAYGWSLGYLRKKGHSDKDIVSKNYLPHFANRAASEAFLAALSKEKITFEDYQQLKKWKQDDILRKHHDVILKKQIELGLKMGEELITIYSKKLIERKVGSISNKDKANRFEIMDFDE